MMAVMSCRLWVSAVLITGTMAACGDSSSGASGLSVMADDSHLVAVGYRELARAQKECIAAVQAGEIQNDADAARCLDDGFTASKLEERIKDCDNKCSQLGRLVRGPARKRPMPWPIWSRPRSPHS